MASIMVVMLVVMSMLWGGAVAQSGCTTALVGLAPCLNYISGSSSTPSSSCCTQLSSVVQSQPQCLCQVLNGGGSNFGVTINQTQALALPSACKVQTPPASRCNAAANQPSGGTSPAGSPTASPGDASTPDEGSSVASDAPTVSTIPSAGTGSKTSTESTSDGNKIKYSLHLTLFLVLIITSSASAIIAV